MGWRPFSKQKLIKYLQSYFVTMEGKEWKNGFKQRSLVEEFNLHKYREASYIVSRTEFKTGSILKIVNNWKDVVSRTEFKAVSIWEIVNNWKDVLNSGSWDSECTTIWCAQAQFGNHERNLSLVGIKDVLKDDQGNAGFFFSFQSNQKLSNEVKFLGIEKIKDLQKIISRQHCNVGRPY